jgi:hypothetical protein
LASGLESVSVSVSVSESGLVSVWESVWVWELEHLRIE